MPRFLSSRSALWGLALVLILLAVVPFTIPGVWFNLPSPLRLVPAIAFFGLMFLVGYLTLRTITERVENSSWPTDAATAHPLPRFVVLLVTTTAAAGLMNFAFRAGWFTPLVLFSAFALMIWALGFAMQTAQMFVARQVRWPYRILFAIPFVLLLMMLGHVEREPYRRATRHRSCTRSPGPFRLPTPGRTSFTGRRRPRRASGWLDRWIERCRADPLIHDSIGNDLTLVTCQSNGQNLRMYRIAKRLQESGHLTHR